MVSTVISKIISMQPNFTVSENAISQYVIGHAEQILTTTITALADETGTSEASINRFCKKLGYKGFNGLKIALAQESFYNNMVQETPSSGGNFIASVTSDYRSMLNNTAALLDESTVFKAAEMIKNAKNINLYALANTTFAAREFRYKLELAGIRQRVHRPLKHQSPGRRHVARRLIHLHCAQHYDEGYLSGGQRIH